MYFKVDYYFDNYPYCNIMSIYVNIGIIFLNILKLKLTNSSGLISDPIVKLVIRTFINSIFSSVPKTISMAIN